MIITGTRLTQAHNTTAMGGSGAMGMTVNEGVGKGGVGRAYK
jgi:hypothetical protein